MNTIEFDHKEVKFEFTTSDKRGRFNMYNKNYTYNNILNGLPETIAEKFGALLANTIQSMEYNKATKITMTLKWE